MTLYTLKQVAKILGRNYHTLYGLTVRQQVVPPALNVADKHLFTSENIEALRKHLASKK